MTLHRAEHRCNAHQVLHEDRCDHDGKSDGVWEGMMRAATVHPFVINQHMKTGTLESVQLAIDDTDDIFVSQLKRDLASLFVLPDRCAKGTRDRFRTLRRENVR